MTVVVAFELVQHGCGVSLVDDQEAVEDGGSSRQSARQSHLPAVPAPVSR
jgi:hypothetical protein